MKAVVTVLGKDAVGILARVSTACADHGANVLEVTQSILGEYFAMMMLVELSGLTCSLGDFAAALEHLGTEIEQQIHVMHEDIFNSMHKI